jgi:tetratricopeptide (TPR) repeat protein
MKISVLLLSVLCLAISDVHAQGSDPASKLELMRADLNLNSSRSSDEKREGSSDPAATIIRNGTRAMSLGNIGEAIDSYKKAIEINPTSYLAQRNLGVVYFSSGRYADAIVNFKEAVNIDPKSADAWAYLGASYYQLRSYNLAVTAYEELLKVSPESAVGYNDVGYAYLGLQRFADAETAFKTALKIHPNSSGATSGLCFVEASSDQSPRTTVEACTRALELDPRSPAVNYMTGYAYVHVAQYEKALTFFETARDLEPQTAITYVAVGRAQLKLGRSRDAVKSFDRALHLQPRMTDALLGRGSAFILMRKSDEAYKLFQEAVETAPNSDEARFDLGLVCLSQRNRACTLQQYNYLKIADSPFAAMLFGKLFADRILVANSVKVPK